MMLLIKYNFVFLILILNGYQITGGGDSSDDSSSSSDSEEEAKPKSGWLQPWCDRFPCQNGATCQNLPGTYKCICAEGWEGTNCQIDIDECRLFASCLHNGIFYNGAGRYSCQCARGWTGKNCEIDINECLMVTCLNGGTCINQIGKYRCECAPGYKGDTCAFDINECLTNNPCLIGGTCTNTVGSYTCQCIEGRTGANCEKANSTSLSSSQAISSEATTVPIVGVKTNDGEYSALHSDDFTVDNRSLIQVPGQGGEIVRQVKSSEHGGISPGSLVGIVVSPSLIIVFLACLVIGILFYRRRKANFTEVYSVGFNKIPNSAAPQSDTRVKDMNLDLALSQQEEDSMLDQRYADNDYLSVEGSTFCFDMGGAKSVDLPICKEIDKEADLGQDDEANHLYDNLEGEKSAGVLPPVPSRNGNLTAFAPKFLQKGTDVLQRYSNNLNRYRK